jgi:hypothetical protein
MTYGFLATNDSNQVLVSSELTHFHYGGQATMSSYSEAYADRYATWPASGSAPYGQSSYAALSGRCIYTFTYTTTAPTYPLFFVKPSDYSRFHAVISQSRSGSTWTVQVIHSGATPAAPELHAFVGPTFLPEPAEDVGLQVFHADGVTAFDSRKAPMSIQGGGENKPPNDPTDGTGFPVVDTAYPSSNIASWGGTGPVSNQHLDHDFRCDTTFTQTPISLPHDKSHYMFCAPSLAQACYERLKMGFYHDPGDYWTGSQDHTSTDRWWALYRSAFRLTDSTFDAGWALYAADHTYEMWYESSFFQGDGGSYWGGDPPFVTQTVNNLADNAFIITDRYMYPP